MRHYTSFGAPYNYSNMTYPEVPMPGDLQEVCEAINQHSNFIPNNCLINNYVEGTSSMGFHSDSVAELVPGTGVAIVSLGETRTLTFRRTQQRDIRWGCPLPHGSLLYMPLEVQLECKRRQRCRGSGSSRPEVGMNRLGRRGRLSLVKLPTIGE
jgi:alkylated DNA repair dioxygenase AlkB